MNEQEMKAAIKYFTPNNHPEIPLGNYHKHIQSLLDLAESYLSIQGFPEEKEVTNGHDLDCECVGCLVAEAEVSGYNQAIQDCKQATLATQDKWYGAGYVDGQNALLKKMDGVYPCLLENIGWFMQEWLDRPMSGEGSDRSDLLQRLAQAIKDHIVGRNISNETLDTIIEKVKDS